MCEVCGNFSNPIRVIWNKTTKKYDQVQIQDQDQVLDTSTTGNNNNKAAAGSSGSAGSVVSSGNIDDLTASIRAVNILRQAKSPPKPMSRITMMGAQMMEDEIKLKAESIKSWMFCLQWIRAELYVIKKTINQVKSI